MATTRVMNGFAHGDLNQVITGCRMNRQFFEKNKNGTWVDIAKINPFLHSETEAQSLIFQHFAYATEQQVKFKELYFGYKGAVEKWRLLQQTLEFPVYLRDYFSWVKDETQVDLVVSLNSKLHRSLSNQKAQKVKSNIKTVNNSKNTRTNEGDQTIGNVP